MSHDKEVEIRRQFLDEAQSIWIPLMRLYWDSQLNG
jgi:hypothetical protein